MKSPESTTIVQKSTPKRLLRRGEFPGHRIVVLGDPHISEPEHELWRREVIPDINALDPDLVVVLGDLTGGPATGSKEATGESVRILSGLESPWVSIIGNHDLQSKDFASDEAAVGMMLEALGREEPGFVVENEDFAVIGLSNTYWRRNTVSTNEIVIDDTQIAWWKSQLVRLGDKPVMMICHAPPIGSGLMVLPELHVCGNNAYVNQNNVPGKIPKVIREHPNILFWFSGHIHLGHYYRDALSRRLGVLYAHTGSASRFQCRDGCRHSRVLEIGPERFRLRTFDHGLRAIDSELDHEEPSGLGALVAARKKMLRKQFVPANPATMDQGYNLPSPGIQRLLFLSDAYGTAPLTPIAARIAAWYGRQIHEQAPDRVILGGNLTQRGLPDQTETFIEALGFLEVPLNYLSGNNEGREFTSPSSARTVRGCMTVRGCVEVEDMERVFLLATSTVEEAITSVDDLLAQLPQRGACLVFAHNPPFLVGEERLVRLQNGPVRIHWICGHEQEASEVSHGNLRVTICAGLDPIKVRGSVPEFLTVDWNGEEATVQRIPVPEKYLQPKRKPLHYAGLAFRGEAEKLLRVVTERKIPAIQFHSQFSKGPATDLEKILARDYRDSVPGAFLSLHLPDFSHPEEGMDLSDQEPWLQWAEDMRLDDLTIHLPNVPANFLFDENGDWSSSAWAENCLQVYGGLSKRALTMGAQISFENIYNKRVNPPGEERLATQPWQLLRFVERMREHLAGEGLGDGELSRVGIIFDVGHAFADVHFSKIYGLDDWLVQLAPYLQLSHIHQVTVQPGGGGTINHQVITDRYGPMINFQGLLSAFRDISEKAFPLLVEVRDQAGALESYETLVATGLLAPAFPADRK